MPAVSFYLRQEVLEAAKVRARHDAIPVSRLVSRAVERYLGLEERDEAKRRVLAALRARPLKGLDALHAERESAGDGRDDRA